MKMNLKWPATNENNKAPWYTIIRRVFAAAIVYPGLALAWVGFLIGWGYAHAVSFWEDNK